MGKLVLPCFLLAVLVSLPLGSNGQGFLRAPYYDQWVDLAMIITSILVFLSIIFFVIFFIIWLKCYNKEEDEEKGGGGCCESFTWGAFHLFVALFVLFVACYCWAPAWVGVLHVGGAIVLAIFWLWFGWFFFAPPSIFNALAKGKRKKKVGECITMKLTKPPYCIIFYIGVLLLFFMGFALGYFLQDACFYGFPLEIETKFMRRNYSPKCEEGGQAPCHVYVTVPERMDTMVIVNFHTLRNVGQGTVYYDTISHAEELSDVPPDVLYSHSMNASYQFLRGVKEVDRWVHWADLLNLQPDTVYYFRAGHGVNATQYTKERSFRTAPSVEPYSFIVGGDMGVTNAGLDTLRGVLEWNQQESLFINVCGDIAYANGIPWCYTRWDEWFYNWDQIRTDDGRIIPILTCAGNHEGGWDITNPEQEAAFYQPYFPHETNLGDVDIYDRSVIHTHDFGNKVRLIVLDSGHYQRAEDQVEWLEEQLIEGQNQGRALMASYHIGIYRSDSSGRDNDNVQEMKKYWGPLFDQYQLQVGYEQHDHSYKRTFPVKDGRAVEEGEFGTVYLGDGAIGVNPIDGDSWDGIFARQFNDVRHAALTYVAETHAVVSSVDKSGVAFDVFLRNFTVPVPPST